MGGHFLIGPQPVCCGNIHSNLIMSSWKKENKRKKKKNGGGCNFRWDHFVGKALTTYS